MDWLAFKNDNLAHPRMSDRYRRSRIGQRRGGCAQHVAASTVSSDSGVRERTWRPRCRADVARGPRHCCGARERRTSTDRLRSRGAGCQDGAAGGAGKGRPPSYRLRRDDDHVAAGSVASAVALTPARRVSRLTACRTSMLVTQSRNPGLAGCQRSARQPGPRR